MPPLPPLPAALERARAETDEAVISPPKSEREVTSADAVPEALAPTSVCAEAVRPPVVATEPSLGYANDCPSAAPSGGADTAAPTRPTGRARRP